MPEESVIVVWFDPPFPDYVNVVSFGGGAPRTFVRDRIDPRIGPARYYPSLRAMIAASDGSTDRMVGQIPETEARRLGLI